jgi:hypothetical protein
LNRNSLAAAIHFAVKAKMVIMRLPEMTRLQHDNGGLERFTIVAAGRTRFARGTAIDRG